MYTYIYIYTLTQFNKKCWYEIELHIFIQYIWKHLWLLIISQSRFPNHALVSLYLNQTITLDTWMSSCMLWNTPSIYIRDCERCIFVSKSNVTFYWDLYYLLQTELRVSHGRYVDQVQVCISKHFRHVIEFLARLHYSTRAKFSGKLTPRHLQTLLNIPPVIGCRLLYRFQWIFHQNPYKFCIVCYKKVQV